MKKLFVISKNSTTNLGNVALTSELISLFSSQRDQSSLIFAGRPIGLNYINFGELEQSDDPAGLFKRWTKRLIDSSKGVEPVWDESFSVREVKYVSSVSTLNKGKRTAKLKTILKQLILPKVASSYKSRLRAMLAADVVIYSGAGEVCDDVVLLRQLVELSIVQANGIKTFAINQSINIRNKKVIQVFREVYSNMHGIVVRGNHSRKILLDMGISETRIRVCPDTAILTTPLRLSSQTNTVAINFTPYTHFSVEGMRGLIDYLRSSGYQVVFVTNDRHSDERIINQFKSEYGVQAMEGQTDHRNFSGSLSKFKFVISSRLHTNVMALAAGVPVVPVEGHFFKTLEMFELFNYPLPVIDKNKTGWEFELVDAVKVLEGKLDDTKKYIEANLNAWREMAKGNYFEISKFIDN